MKLSNIFGSAIGALLAILVFVFILFLFLGGIISSIKEETQRKKTVEKQSVLHINMDQPIREKSSRNEWQGFNLDKLKPIHQLGLNELKLAIHNAATDDKIEAILLDLNYVEAGLAVTHEIGVALNEFKKSDKKVIAYGNAFNEKAFYLSTFADETYINPSGFIEFNGWAVEIVYFKKMLEKLGVEPVLFRVGKYKSAMEPFIREDMSEANRVQVTTFINSVYNSILKDMSMNTKIDSAELKNISDNMLVKTPEEAIASGLIKDAIYYDEMIEKLPTKELLTLEDYLDVITDEKEKETNTIAIIVAEGPIVDGNGDKDEIGGTSLSETLRKVRKDSTIQAVVLRVNSPGGSALASDIIWREVKLISEVKPIIASMSDYAASGGYYISMPANKIVANPQTITGSIGVFGMLLNAEKFLDNKLGITTDRVTTGKYANIGSFTRPVTQEEATIIQSAIDSIYSTFITKAAEGRNMTKDAIHEIAQGRVWSGTDALKIGLIDALGTLETAVELAANEAKLEKYSIEYYPKKKNWYEKLFDMDDAETQLIARHLGEYKKYLNVFMDVKNIQGLQTRMPYLLTIE